MKIEKEVITMQPIRMETTFEQFISLLEVPDFHMLMTIAVGSRHILHGEIANLYKENQDTYYQYYKKSSYYQDHRLVSLSVQNYRAIQQFTGIYLYERTLDSTDITMKLVKKGYRFVYHFVKNHKNVDLYQLRDDYIAYVKKNTFEKNIHAAHLFGVALFLCKQLNKKIIFDDFDLNLIKSSIHQIFLEIETKPLVTSETENFIEPYKSVGLMKNFSLPLKDLIVLLNKYHTEENDQDFYKGLSEVALMLQYCNINPLDIQNITNIDQDILKDVVTLCLTTVETPEEATRVLGTNLLIYAIAKDYNETKHGLIVTSQEETQQELLKVKQEYKTKLMQLRKEESRTALEMKRLTDLNDVLENRVQDLESQLRKNEKNLSDKEEQLKSLENEYEELQRRLENQKESKKEPISENEMARVLKDKNCVIVGGLKSWQDQLRTYLPTARFIQPEELNINYDFLLKADIVLFNESFNNHSMYQKIKSILENTKIPLCYSGRNTNMKLTLEKMYEVLMETE